MLFGNFSAPEYKEQGYFECCSTSQAVLRLWFLSDNVLRLKIAPDGQFKEHSYALITTAWDDDLDDLLKDERQRIKPLQPSCQVVGRTAYFETATLKIALSLDYDGLCIIDKASGQVVHRDLKDRAFERDHLGRVIHYQTIDYEHHSFFGMGESTGKLDKKGRHLYFCPRDSIGADPVQGMPLYKLIPLCIKADDRSGYCCGLFYNNSHDMTFDLGNERSGYWDRYAYARADGGPLDIFFIHGPTVKEVVARYCKLTGCTALPPKHALGFTLSTMYYAELEEKCDEEIYKVIEKMRAEGMLVDNFWLASGYSSGEEDNLRYTFNWNKKRFPDPQGFFKKMQEHYHVNVIPNLKPGVLQHHPYLKYYEEHDALIKTPDNKANFLGRWWGGPGYFVDFTSPKGREAWAHLLNENILKLGCTTVWNDNNEMDGVYDRTARVYGDGDPTADMTEYKAVQSNMMAYLARKVMAKAQPQVRPYVINRAGFAGIQRYAQVWGGDNITSWDCLKYNVALILGMGLSGCANMGCDIGGFTGPAPEAELLLRWMQQGAFQPRFVLNSANTDNTVTQPFMYPEVAEGIKQALELRAFLYPYWYSLFYEAAQTGAPIVRPLFYEFPQDVRCLHDEHLTFMLGAALLVANVLEKGATTRKLYLPQGASWYDLNDNFKCYAGGQEIEVPVGLNTIPLFLRSDAIMPTSHDLKQLMVDKLHKLTWFISHSANEPVTFVRYDDDGVTRAHEQGDYLKTTVTVNGSQVITIDFADSGNYANSVSVEELLVPSPNKGALFVSLDGKKLRRCLTVDDYEATPDAWYYDLSTRCVKVKYHKPQTTHYVVQVSCEHFDLIGMENNGLTELAK